MIVLSVGTSGQGALRFHIRFSWGLPVIDAGEARKVPYRRVEEHMQRRSAIMVLYVLGMPRGGWADGICLVAFSL